MKNFMISDDDKYQKRLTLSAIIVTRNNPEEVSKLVNILTSAPCINEIIIIDSSSAHFYEKLVKYLSNGYRRIRDKVIKILRFPPLGSPTGYDHIAFSISKNDLVLYLEDDEYVSQSDLIKLCRFIHENYPRFKAFLIRRKEHYLRNYSLLLKIFDRRFVHAIGIIHWHFITKEKPRPAPIVIDHKSKITLKTRLKKLRSYALIDSYQIGYKVHKIIFASIKGENLYKVDGSSLNRIPQNVLKSAISFYKLCSRVLGAVWGNIIFVLLAFNIYYIFQTVKEILRLENFMNKLVEAIVYTFFITLYTLRSPYKHAKIWRLIVKNDGFSNLIWKILPSITKSLNYDENPIENFKKIIDAICG